MQPQKIYLTRKEAAEFINGHGLPTTWKTLQKLASVGEGPKYKRFGRNTVYTEADLLEWMERKLEES